MAAAASKVQRFQSHQLNHGSSWNFFSLLLLSYMASVVTHTCFGKNMLPSSLPPPPLVLLNYRVSTKNVDKLNFYNKLEIIAWLIIILDLTLLMFNIYSFLDALVLF